MSALRRLVDGGLREWEHRGPGACFILFDAVGPGSARRCSSTASRTAAGTGRHWHAVRRYKGLEGGSWEYGHGNKREQPGLIKCPISRLCWVFHFRKSPQGQTECPLLRRGAYLQDGVTCSHSSACRAAALQKVCLRNVLIKAPGFRLSPPCSLSESQCSLCWTFEIDLVLVATSQIKLCSVQGPTVPQSCVLISFSVFKRRAVTQVRGLVWQMHQGGIARHARRSWEEGHAHGVEA